MFHVKHSLDDTIAAIATPVGVGGVGVVRISGDRVIGISEKIIDKFPKRIEPQRIYHGWAASDGNLIDEILYYHMKAPHSYTGEDVVEINCHGGFAILRAILNAAIKAGARMAERGEFTKRAFLNKKLDLSQAESVLDLIAAPTEKSARFALGQLEGRLSKIALDMRKKLLGLLAEVEATIDFSEDVPELNYKELHKKIGEQVEKIEGLLKTAMIGKVFKEGLATTIIGKPNVGKSSLLNSLLGEERAIVTEVPGTTRDTIEEILDVHGVPLRIIDTAGIRHPKDRVEEFGIVRTEREIADADFIVMVVDASQGLDEMDKVVILRGKGKKGVVVLNKIDLGRKITDKELKGLTNGFKVYETSALTGQGINELIDGIHQGVQGFCGGEGESAIAINSRHRECLTRAKEGLERAIEGQDDCIAIDLKEAVMALGEISGELVSEEVINAIFEKFCVGK